MLDRAKGDHRSLVGTGRKGKRRAGVFRCPRRHDRCGVHSWTVLLIFAATCASLSTAVATWVGCEDRDGDCPVCPHPWLSGKSPVAKVYLSNESQLVASATRAETYLRNLSPSYIQRFDNPQTGLHTSLFYFCCHTAGEIARMKTAFQQMRWNSFIINYDFFGCNLDHDNKTVYLHSLPRNQTDLFSWASHVEKTLRDFNVTVHHPRKSLFHMTLARVDPTYPVETAVRNLSTDFFGSHQLCSFEFEGDTYYADDCVSPSSAT